MRCIDYDELSGVPSGELVSLLEPFEVVPTQDEMDELMGYVSDWLDDVRGEFDVDGAK
jgi:hypothetical protein